VATGDSGCEAYTAIAWGVGLSHERSDVAGAESFYSLEGNMCGTAMRGADALPGSKATSRAKGSHRKLGGLGSGRQGRVRRTVRIVILWLLGVPLVLVLLLMVTHVISRAFVEVRSSRPVSLRPYNLDLLLRAINRMLFHGKIKFTPTNVPVP
jgi:hypothetical protein